MTTPYFGERITRNEDPRLLSGRALFVNLSDMLDDLEVFRPEDIEKSGQVRGGDFGLKELHNKRITLGVFPRKFKGGEAAFWRAVAWA